VSQNASADQAASFDYLRAVLSVAVSPSLFLERKIKKCRCRLIHSPTANSGFAFYHYF